MDPMDALLKIAEPRLTQLVKDQIDSGAWMWVEDPQHADVWAVMEGETKTVLLVVYPTVEDFEVSQRLEEKLEELR